MVLIQTAGSIQTFKGPQKNDGILFVFTKLNCPGNYALTYTGPLKFRLDNKPAQTGPFLQGQLPVNGNGTGKISVNSGHPEAVSVFIEFTDESRKLPADLGFKGGVKSPVLMVIDGMEFGMRISRFLMHFSASTLSAASWASMRR